MSEWTLRWKRAAKHEHQRRKSAEKLWLRGVFKQVQTELELRKTKAAVTLMGHINDAEARDWDAIIAERSALEARLAAAETDNRALRAALVEMVSRCEDCGGTGREFYDDGPCERCEPARRALAGDSEATP